MKYIFIVSWTLYSTFTTTKCPNENAFQNYGQYNKCEPHNHTTKIARDTSISFMSSKKAHEFYEGHWRTVQNIKFDSVIIQK